MADDWEKEDFEPPAIDLVQKPDNRWDGEDEEDSVKDSWDAPDNESNSSKPATTGPTKKKRNLQQIIAEKEEKKRREAEERRKKFEAEDGSDTPEAQLAEKLRRQKMQEEADLEIARECFGVKEASISTKEGFDELRQLLVSRLSSCETSPLYVAFLDDLLREISVSLDADDVKKLSSTLTAVYNEKIKAQKAAKGKKKPKAKLHLGKEDENFELGNEYEDFM